MSLRQPNPRADARPRRHVDPNPAPLREAPLRTYSFDPDAARRAWRQVARTRGAHGMRLDGRDGGGRLAPIALCLAALAAGALWWASDDEATPVEPPTVSAKVAAVERDPGVSVGPLGRLAKGSEPRAPELGAPPLAAVPPRAALVRQPEPEPAPPMPKPASRVTRQLPPGTPVKNAKALRRVPRGRSDRPPMGGVGAEGIHVDRITMGTAHEQGTCSGPVGRFSLREDKVAHVCFRVVHQRIEQRVIVRWERNGRLMRRTFVQIAARHGYRTRAGLTLRRLYQGDWTARIMSSDGVELARHDFQISS